jgi:hypothetical protein
LEKWGGTGKRTIRCEDLTHVVAQSISQGGTCSWCGAGSGRQGLCRWIASRTVFFDLRSVLCGLIEFALVIGAGLCSVFEFVLVFLLTIQNFLHMLGMRFALAGFFCFFVGLFLQIVSISLQRIIPLFEPVLALSFSVGLLLGALFVFGALQGIGSILPTFSVIEHQAQALVFIVLFVFDLPRFFEARSDG